MACKPGSVHAEALDGHSSWAAVANNLPATYPDGGVKTRLPALPGDHPYSVLLPVGFTMPVLSPGRRCALTAPFHPYSATAKRFAFCGTFPRVTPAGRYPAPCLHGARTFLEPAGFPCGPRPSSHLIDGFLGPCLRKGKVDRPVLSSEELCYSAAGSFRPLPSRGRGVPPDTAVSADGCAGCFVRGDGAGGRSFWVSISLVVTCGLPCFLRV